MNETPILFDRVTGKYILASIDIAELTGLRVQDIEWYITQIKDHLTTVGDLAIVETEQGRKYIGLNPVHLHLLCCKYKHIGNNERVQQAQVLLICAVQDDKQLAEDFNARKQQLGIH